MGASPTSRAENGVPMAVRSWKGLPKMKRTVNVMNLVIVLSTLIVVAIPVWIVFIILRYFGVV